MPRSTLRLRDTRDIASRILINKCSGHVNARHLTERQPDDGRTGERLNWCRDNSLDQEAVSVSVDLLFHVWKLSGRVCLRSSPSALRFHVLCVVGPALRKVAPFLLSSPAGTPFVAAGSCPHCHTQAQTQPG